MEEKNAIIESAKISTEDYGCLSAWVFLDYSGAGQGFGGFNLHSVGTMKPEPNYAGVFIAQTMKIAGVETWENLKGKSIRVRVQDGSIKQIGHIIKDDWFDVGKVFGEME